MSAEAAVRARLQEPRTRCRHGRWTLEVRADEVADVRFDGVLLLRAVRPVVRDRDWNTLDVTVVSTASADGDGLVRELLFTGDGIRYATTLTVGWTDEELVVDFAGRAETAFARNRIGLVVLHPATEAGRPVTVRHPDGRTEAGRWPERISPHQPFLDVAGFAWEADGVRAELDLEGEVFETEDQRNWTDASFKTYGTPLSRPFPVPVTTGEHCAQRLRLRASGRAAHRPAPSPAEIAVGSAELTRLPAVGVGAALYPPAAPAGRAVRYPFVLVELTEPVDRWEDAVETTAAQAAAWGAALDVRVVAPGPEAVAHALALLVNRPVTRVAVFDPESHVTTPELWTALRAAATRTGSGAALVAGSRAHFTELNRQQAVVPPDAPALTFSLTPQMHASELPHLVDSLAAQRTVAVDAVRLAGRRPVHVGPVTLARRFNAVATGARPDPAVAAERAVDPLQGSAFAAAWTVGSLAALAVPGVATVCCYETAGPRGIVAADGTDTPVAPVLDTAAALAGRPVLACRHPDGVAALPVRGGDGRITLLLGELTGQARSLPVSWAGGRTVVELAPWSARRVRLG